MLSTTLHEQDNLVIASASQWIREGKRVYLVTVISTFGSSPRPAGSLMAITEDGIFAGSISGGCLEDDVRQKIAKHDFSSPLRIDYDNNSREYYNIGLPCGGHLSLLVEDIRRDARFLDFFDHINKREIVRRVVTLDTGTVSLQIGHDVLPEFSCNATTVSKRFGPSRRLLIIGANLIAYYLAQFAQATQFDVIICDPRDAISIPNIPQGCRFTRQMPDDAVLEYACDNHCAVVTLTHDPKHDDLALMDALASPAFYVGALGSTRSAEKRAQRLITLGLTNTQIQRLCGPAGIAIGSKTPAEIAISILAEIIATKNELTKSTQTAQTNSTLARETIA